MQKYSVGTDVKHRYTDMFRIWPAAFRKSQIWVFR